MAIGDYWDHKKMLDLYLHDYMVKRELHETAATFKKEANICDHSVVIDSPQGFFAEWWSIFSEIYASRQLDYQKGNPEVSLQAMESKVTEQRNIHSTVPSIFTMNQQYKPEQFPSNGFDNMLGMPAARQFADNFYEKEHISHSDMHFDPNFHPLGVNKSNLSNLSPASPSLVPPQMFKRSSQGTDKRNGISLGRPASLDSMLNGLRSDIFPVSRPHDAGMSKGVNQALNGWPLNGPNGQQKFPVLLSDCQQPLWAQALPWELGKQAAEPGNSANFCSSNRMIAKSDVKGKCKKMIGPSIKTAENPHQCDHHHQQQLLDNGRKRKAASRSRTEENSVDCIKAKEDRSVPEDVEIFFSYEGDNDKSTSTPFSALQGHSTSCTEYEHQGFTFEEIDRFHLSKSKVLCCHFSSDGKLLASAGHEKKVFIANVDTRRSVSTSEEHSFIITDVRFQPSSTIFATSSFDKTVKIWDAARPSRSLVNLLGHSEQVTSLDFHPSKVDLLCSCDHNDEIRFWNVKKSTCTHFFKGATKKVRFQPASGKLLVTASGNRIKLFDTEKRSLESSWKGHVNDVLSVCWDYTGNYILSVSEDSARVWSTLSVGKCIYELPANGNKFQSCTFHPDYDHLCIIGGYQNLELWNPVNKGRLSIQAHKGLVAALAESSPTGTVASASHDQVVKLWK